VFVEMDEQNSRALKFECKNENGETKNLSIKCFTEHYLSDEVSTWMKWHFIELVRNNASFTNFSNSD
jgi:hypothetical protein